MKAARLIINIALIIGIILSTYFLQLSLTPEGYTGIFIVFKYDVHSPRNPLILLVVFVIAMLAFNWKALATSRNKFKLFGLFSFAAILLAGVFFFLDFKRHNRLPWERPNVVMIVVDTLRADHVSAYGTNKARTPNIDSLADDGWLFERAYSHIPITMPSHSSLFTGRLPHDVAVLNNRDDFTFPEKALAEILKDDGYKTAAVISLGVLKANFHLDRGFDHYDDRLPGNGQWYNRANDITDRGIAWLDKSVDAEKGDKFFLWLHYSDPHEPYNPPNTPPDTSVELNGTELMRGSLDSAGRMEIALQLKPGKNVIAINRLPGENIAQFLTHIYFSGENISKGPFPENWQEPLRAEREKGKAQFRRKLNNLQMEQFLSKANGLSFAGLNFREGRGWHPPDKNANRPRRSLTARALLEVTNTTGQEMTVTFNIKGGVYKSLEQVKRQYIEETEYVDQEIGRFLDYLKRQELMDDTIIVFLSDHGEEFNEHGMVGHIHNLYTQSLHVPLIIRDPDADRKNVRINKTARLIDVTPTILDMVGLKKPEYMYGRTLLEYILRNRGPERPLYSQTFMPEAEDNKFGILEDDQLGIYLPEAERIRKYEMYNLSEDRYQWKNQALTPGTGNFTEFSDKASRYAESITAENSVKPDEVAEYEREEMLRDLGYVTGAATPTVLTNIGVPAESLLNSIRDALMSQRDLILQDPVIEAKQFGSSAEAPYYISIELALPEDNFEQLVMSLQHHIKNTVVAQSRQFPLRLVLKSGERLVMDKVFPGNTDNIVHLFSFRLLRLLMHQPFGTSLSANYERFYIQVSKSLEEYLGVTN